MRSTTAKEWRAIQEARCQDRLGVSRDEFLAGWKSGRYSYSHDLDDHCDIVAVAILFPDLDDL
jgi:hypothetical protein